ncbi:zinc-finger domain-containing protein [Candidatus Berkiella aquae]|uniref:Zinc-finger domain protein n=1 Tax=Candidatus Berkiella aquae TaxID=295108 RepID=A0A0Q9YJZ3_9GAMM|nr:zinc-finger domain-containing protein [Candidatus Berkiella aquae]MCS5710132.1 zinc-finger domain-containing protein [Candidatus Berkiella aquae]
MNPNDKKLTASASKLYKVSKSDLPLSCPMPDMVLWNSHPKVYLPIEKTGKASCPYCGAGFELTDFKSTT